MHLLASTWIVLHLFAGNLQNLHSSTFHLLSVHSSHNSKAKFFLHFRCVAPLGFSRTIDQFCNPLVESTASSSRKFCTSRDDPGRAADRHTNFLPFLQVSRMADQSLLEGNHSHAVYL